MLAVLFFCSILCEVEEIPHYSEFTVSFYRARVLDFIKCFSASIDKIMRENGQKSIQKKYNAEKVYVSMIASLIINAYTLEGDTVFFACLILTKQRNSNFF